MCFRKVHNKFQFSILVFLLLAIYTEIPLFFSDTFFVPAFLIVFSIPVLFVLNRKYVLRCDAAFIGKICLILLLSAFLSPGIAFLGHKLSGVLQTTTSIVAGMLLIKTMDHLEKGI